MSCRSRLSDSKVAVSSEGRVSSRSVARLPCDIQVCLRGAQRESRWEFLLGRGSLSGSVLAGKPSLRWAGKTLRRRDRREIFPAGLFPARRARLQPRERLKFRGRHSTGSARRHQVDFRAGSWRQIRDTVTEFHSMLPLRRLRKSASGTINFAGQARRGWLADTLRDHSLENFTFTILWFHAASRNIGRVSPCAPDRASGF